MPENFWTLAVILQKVGDDYCALDGREFVGLFLKRNNHHRGCNLFPKWHMIYRKKEVRLSLSFIFTVGQ